MTVQKYTGYFRGNYAVALWRNWLLTTLSAWCEIANSLSGDPVIRVTRPASFQQRIV